MNRFYRHSSLVVLFLSLLFAACGTSATTSIIAANGTVKATRTSIPPTPVTCTNVPTGSGCTAGMGLATAIVYTEPEAGDLPIVNAIAGAKSSVWVEVYLLTERNVINALEKAASQGIDVRVMLEGHPYGGGSVSPQETISTLKAAGVKAQEASPAFALTHTKMMLVDATTAYISTANYTLSALGGSSTTANREFIVQDTDSTDVAECNAIFTADWQRVSPTLSDPHLVISPVNSRVRILALVNSATKSLHVEEEEMQDVPLIQALIAAQKRGVTVQIAVPKPTPGSNDSLGEQELQQAGVTIVQIQDDSSHHYIHAKDIIADSTIAYVGSVNASAPSMDKNREVGVLLADSQAIQTLETAFQDDFTSVKK